MAITATSSRTSSGCTSGVGLASANTIGCAAIVRTASAGIGAGPGQADRDVGAGQRLGDRALEARAGSSARRTRAARRRGPRAPRRRRPCGRSRSGRATPCANSMSATAIPAAPTPTITTRTSSARLSTRRSALISAASTTIAVPCWSSWKTGMSSSSFSRRSISKQRGAAMSSRLMPPNPGASAFTTPRSRPASFVSRQIGHASTPPNSLNSIALPSITGMAASGPISPSPSTAVPSVTTATVLPLIGQRPGRRRVVVDRHADPRHAGRVGHREVVAGLDRHLRA